jgi:hypothetical protein
MARLAWIGRSWSARSARVHSDAMRPFTRLVAGTRTSGFAQRQFYLIYLTSLVCLIAMGWAAALFL